MLYSVQEASKLLNTSRVTIYNKIEKLKELKPHIKVKNNAKYITVEGIELIRQSINDNQQSKVFTNIEEEKEEDTQENINNNSVVNDFTPLQNDLIQVLKEQIQELKEQITEIKEDKQKQIEHLQEQLQVKDKQIDVLTKLHENNQVLFPLLSQVQQKVFLLEQEQHPEQEQKKWWKKMFV